MNLESKYTKPRSDCPNPEYWHALDGQGTEIEISNLVASMIGALQPEVVLETGTHNADSAFLIGRALLKNGHGRLLTVELDEKKVAKAKLRLRGLPVTVIHSDSLSYQPLISIDFLWIDGLTTSERHKEWHHYKHFLSDRGVVMFHDTGPHRIFRSNLERDNELSIIHLPTPRGVSIGRRRVSGEVPSPSA